MYVNNGYLVNNQYKLPASPVQVPAFVQPQLQGQIQDYLPPYSYPVVSQAAQQYNQVVASQVATPVLDRFPIIKEKLTTTQVNAVTPLKESEKTEYKNDLRKMFQDNKAVIYALIPRTFNAKDTSGNGLIEAGEQNGTFINAIERLDELKGYGINTLHILPIHPPGKKRAMGTAGSVYAPVDYLAIDPKLDDPNDPRDVKEEFKQFIKDCHKRGIKVMLDLPSCASLDMYEKRPELMAKDANGFPKIPQGWEDIRMFEPWADKDKKILNKELLDLHKKYVDMCIELGVDGIRADVARAKPVEFWNEIIPYARSKDPEFAFLAESYTYEDASPMLNMNHDRPEDLLRAGFDSYYGQYHLFNTWSAKDFHKNMIDNLKMTQDMDKGKSLIGSFASHDDKSPMTNGGPLYCMLTAGIQETLPMTNPYYVTGFESGDRYMYDYKGKKSTTSSTECQEYTAHNEKLDLFNLSRRPGGEHPEIGQYMNKMIQVRKQYEDVITKGSYIPLKVEDDKNEHIIAYARHLNGKTLLAIANKDVNARETSVVKVPGLKAGIELKDLAPGAGLESAYKAVDGGVEVDLAPARFHLFEINTPEIEKSGLDVYKQNL